MNTENYVQMMIDSLKMKLAVLQKLITFNETQQQLILAEPFSEEDLRENVELKSDQIDELERLDSGFNQLFEHVKIQLEADKAAYKEEIATIQGLIRSVTEASVQVEAGEKRNKALLEQHFSSMRKEFSQAKRNVQMANKYYQNMNKLNYEPQLMDHKN